jgi:hypothetical protein
MGLGVKSLVVRPRNGDEYGKKVKTDRRDALAAIGGWIAMCTRWKSTFTTNGPSATSAVSSSAAPACRCASKAARAS